MDVLVQALDLLYLASILYILVIPFKMKKITNNIKLKTGKQSHANYLTNEGDVTCTVILKITLFYSFEDDSDVNSLLLHRRTLKKM